MKVVIVGGTGRIGRPLVARLREQGHEAVPASPTTGVDTVSGEGLLEALEGADVVVDVSNPPSAGPGAAMAFFTASTRNLLGAGRTVGVRHHVALSVVGADRMVDGDYMDAKLAQERLIRAGPRPFSIVRATQFFEFVGTIVDVATDGDVVRLPPVPFQPVAADEVAGAVSRVAVGRPANGVVEVAGPERFRMDEFVRGLLGARGDRRSVLTDPTARYFGVALDERTLVPGPGARLGEVTFERWAERGA